jgi:hypothetical protein
MKIFFLAVWFAVFTVVYAYASVPAPTLTPAQTPAQTPASVPMFTSVPISASASTSAPVSTSAPAPVAELSAEQQGDAYMASSDSIFAAGDAVKNIDLAIAKYENALETRKITGKLLVKYVGACDFKYRYFTAATEKKKDYEALIKRFEPQGGKMSGSKQYNYVMALLWGRRGEITQNIYDNSNKAVAEKIKYYGEALYAEDKTYHGYFACKILGRVHYLSPNIPFMMPWPDKNKSKAYLEELVKGDPGNTEGKMFLADTLKLAGDKKTAKKLLTQIAASVPRKGSWFYDTLAIKQSNERLNAK